MLRAPAVTWALLGLACSGRTFLGDGGEGDGPTDGGPDLPWRCTPHETGTPWCANTAISVSVEPPNAEPALSIDAQGRAVAGWIAGAPGAFELAVAGRVDDFALTTRFGSTGTFAFDPTLAVDGDRTHLVFLTTQDQLTSTLLATFSDDGGQTWSPRIEISDDGTHFHDRPWVSVGAAGEVVVGWKEEDVATEESWHRVIVSTDRGQSFSPRARIDGPINGSRRLPPYGPIGFAADGAMVWAFGELSTGGAYAVQYARSTDGGSNFALTPLESWATTEWPPGGADDDRHLKLSHQVTVAAAGGPVYLAMARPAGGTWQRDLRVRVAADGQAFAGEVQVNQNAGAVSHMLPQLWIVADEQGGAHVGWYEQRSGQWGLYTSSTADGATWSAAAPVSDEPFVADDWGPALERDELRWPGHFFGLDARDGYLYAAWGDIRTGEGAIFYAETAVPLY